MRKREREREREIIRERERVKERKNDFKGWMQRKKGRPRGGS